LDSIQFLYIGTAAVGQRADLTSTVMLTKSHWFFRN